MPKITYGIKNVHYASKTVDASNNPIFGVVKDWTGASEMSLPPVGDPVKIYADDVIYYKGHVNQGYDGNLDVYAVPEDFKITHMGEYKDTNGVMIEKSSTQPLDFALLGEFQTDETPKRFALYNCSAGRADLTGKTKEDTFEANLFSIPITCSPTEKDEVVKASILKTDNEEVFNAWFDSVYYNPAYVSLFNVTITAVKGATPIANAVVVLGDKIAKTNTSGIAKFVVSNGTYDILLSAAGYAAKTDTITVASTAISKTVTMTAV